MCVLTNIFKCKCWHVVIASSITFIITLSLATNTNSQRLKTHVEYLASDNLEGRVPGSLGDVLAREYLVKNFLSIKLDSLFEEGYLQYFPFLYRIESSEQALFTTISSDDDTVTYSYGTDFIEDVTSNSGTVIGKVAFIGYGIHDSMTGYSDYDHIELKDKVVICYLLPPRKYSTNRLKKLNNSLSYFEKVKYASDRGAAAFIFVLPKEYSSLQTRAEIFSNKIPSQHISQCSIPVIRITQNTFNSILSRSDVDLECIESQLYHTEYRTPQMIDSLLVGVRTNITFNYRNTCNVIGMSKGTNSEGIIIVGAHYDHMGLDKKGNIRLGANDNASGVSVLLELASIIKSQSRTNYDFIFVAFGMEEWGNIGSQYFVNNMPFGSEKVKAMINLDMVGKLRDNKLYLFHTQSAEEWILYLNSANVADIEFVIMSNTSPSDSEVFNQAKIPTLFIYTGPDEINDYSKESKHLNYIGMENILILTRNLLKLLSLPTNTMTYYEDK